MKRLVIIVLSLSLLICLCPKTIVKADSMSEDYQLIMEIENELNKKNSSITKELENTIVRLERLLQNDDCCLQPDDRQKINDLIAVNVELLMKCNEFMSVKETGRAKELTRGYYDIAIAAVKAWFSLNGYYLAEELLDHAYQNSTLNSYYYPVYGNRVIYSPVYNNIKYNLVTTSGSDTFPSSSNTILQDLYYAIHIFTWSRMSGNTIFIHDRYDFSGNDYSQWGTIAGYAVSVMYNAQQAGYLTPYYVTIVQ